MSTEELQHGWCVAVFTLAVLLALVFWIYHDTVLYLVNLWNQLADDYGHGYVVLAISAYLILRNRPGIAALAPRINYRALLAVLVFSLLWLLAALVDVQILQAIAFLLLIIAIIWTALGSHITRKLLFPQLFIWLIISRVI